MSIWRHSGGALILVLASARTLDSFAAPSPPATPVTSDDGVAASLAAQQDAAELRALKVQFAKLTALPKPTTDEVYQQAAKKAGLDFGALRTEHQALVQEKDLKVRDTKLDSMREKYTPLMLKVSKDAGVDVVGERKKAVQAYAPAMSMPAPKTAELTVKPGAPPNQNATPAPKTAEIWIAPPKATPVVRELPLSGFVMTEPTPPAEAQPAPLPPTTVVTTLTTPFPIRGNTSNNFGAAASATGQIEIAKGSHFFDMGLESASLGKTFVARAGQRRFSVTANLNDVRWWMIGNAIGHVAGMIRIVLVVHSGTDVLCNTGISMAEWAASGLVYVNEHANRPPFAINCSFTRPADAGEKTLTATVRFSTMSVSAGTPAEMFSALTGRLGSIRVAASP